MNETLVKYLAGLLDADGCLSFRFVVTQERTYSVRLNFSLTAAESIDRNGKFIKGLPEETGIGTVTARQQDGKWAVQNTWHVRSWNELNKIIPRVIKHQVIKARHWDWMYGIATSLRGKNITEQEKEMLIAASKESRANNSGPLKDKKHPTWAWVTGYLEGDGSFEMRYLKRNNYTRLSVVATAHKNDVVALELLRKAFGGEIYSQDNVNRWKRNLGQSQKSFALRFLPKLIRHSRLKKHKIEQMIAFHNH